MIEGYKFGEVEVEGRKYTSDLIITPQGVRPGWRRKAGHELCPEDIRGCLSGEIETLVVGTGDYGMVRVLPETEEFLSKKSIELIAQPTAEACEAFNRLCAAGERGKVVAAFHLTC